jgi:hypothetical protein
LDAADDPATDREPDSTTHSSLAVALRDAAGVDVKVSDTDLFSTLDVLFKRAEDERGINDPGVRALGLEAAIFGWHEWDTLSPLFTSAEVHDLLATRMSSASARIRARVGEYLFRRGDPKHRRHAGAAAEAGLAWARTLASSRHDAERHHMLHAVRALEQAERLALTANQSAIVDDACSLVVELAADASARGDAHDAAFLSGVITELRTRFSPMQRDELLSLLTTLQAPAVAAITPANPPLIAGRLLESRRQLCLAGRNEDGARACDREYATLLANNAAARTDSFAAAIDLEEAITLAERGQADDITLNDYRTQRRGAMQRGMDQMPAMKFQVRIPPEIEEARRRTHIAMLNLPIDEFLAHFGRLNMPNTKLLEASVAAARSHTPLTTLIPRVAIASAGETVVAGTDDETLLFEHGLRLLQIGTQTDLRPLWEQRLAAGELSASAISDYLRASGNFDDDALDMIAEGIEAAVVGKPVLAIPLLVTQFEDVLRQILRRAGHDPSHHNASDQNVTEEISQGSVLLGLVKKGVITADQLLFFRLVIDEPLGLNLRNRTGHGRVRRPDCSTETMLLLLQCYLVVAALGG